MDCPFPQCGAWSSVKETRQKPDGMVRYRCCANGHRFRTVERVEVAPERKREKNTARLNMILKLMVNYGAPMKTSQIEKSLQAIGKISVNRMTLLRDLHTMQSLGLITLNKKSSHTMLWDATKQG